MRADDWLHWPLNGHAVYGKGRRHLRAFRSSAIISRDIHLRFQVRQDRALKSMYRLQGILLAFQVRMGLSRMSSKEDHQKDTPRQDEASLESILDRFEQAWQHGVEPEIDQFLPGQSGEQRDLLVELVHMDLECRLKAGQAIRVENYLHRYPALAQDRLAVLDMIAAEFDLRWRTEPLISIDEYTARFPQYGDQLRSRLKPSARFERRRAAVRVNCPHCQSPIQFTGDEAGEEVTCSSCGSSFRIEPGRDVSWSGEKLPQIGRFQLLERIGRGAFGTVYRARDSELDRTVALKVPRSGNLVTDQDEERFEREARAVAQLRHAGIVAVYEVGRTESFPYLVCEFVKGITLSSALTGKRFGFRHAAELTVQLADALDHAHRQGVVHRDLKPSNVMLEKLEVTEQENTQATAGSSATPALGYRARLMDFGLARRDDEEVTVTLEGEVLGTPAYMSPEQARGDNRRVDGRSDIYSLGIMLYELLVGELPFRGNREMLLHQMQFEAPRPLRSLNNRVPRDLETITLKCLQKDRGRRYTTAGELAADLGRWLAGETIRARPVGRTEQFFSWCRRNPRVAILASSVLVLLATIATVSTTLAIRIHLEQIRTKEAQLQADQGLQFARRAADQFFTLASDQTLLNAPGMQPVRKELLNSAREFFAQFVREHADDPTLQIDLAAASLRVAQISVEFEEYDSALISFVKGLEILERMLTDNPEVNLAASLPKGLFKGRLRRPLDQLETTPDVGGVAPIVLNQTERARRIWDQLIERYPDVRGFRNDLAGLLILRGIMHDTIAQTEQAMESFDQARQIWEGLHREDPNDENVQSDLAVAWGDMAGVLMRKKQFSESLKTHERGIAVVEDLNRRHPGVPSFRYDLAGTYYALGVLHERLGNPNEALLLLEKAKAGMQSLHQENPSFVNYERDWAAVLRAVGDLHHRQARVDESLPFYGQVVAVRKKLFADHPDESDFRIILDESLEALSVVQRSAGQPEAAASTLLDRKTLWPEDAAKLYEVAADLAQCISRQGQNPEALRLIDESSRQSMEDNIIQTLREAISAGFADHARLDKDPSFAAIHEHRAFVELLNQLKK